MKFCEERQKLHLMEEYETPKPVPMDLMKVYCTKTAFLKKIY